MLQIANRFKPSARHTNAALDCLHYLLGRSTFNTSFVTWVGTKWAMNPHHRPSAADKVEQPWPGLLVGGPNSSGKLDKPARSWKDGRKLYPDRIAPVETDPPQWVMDYLAAEAAKVSSGKSNSP